LAEFIAQREHPFLGPRLLFVAPRPAERSIEPVALNSVEQRDRLEPVSGSVRAGFLADPALVNRLLDGRDEQAFPEPRDAAIAELEHLGKVVARVDMEDRERERRGPKGLFREAEQHH
jgi:hypothetical protein